MTYSVYVRGSDQQEGQKVTASKISYLGNLQGVGEVLGFFRSLLFSKFSKGIPKICGKILEGGQLHQVTPHGFPSEPIFNPSPPHPRNASEKKKEKEKCEGGLPIFDQKWLDFRLYGGLWHHLACFFLTLLFYHHPLANLSLRKTGS